MRFQTDPRDADSHPDPDAPHPTDDVEHARAADEPGPPPAAPAPAVPLNVDADRTSDADADRRDVDADADGRVDDSEPRLHPDDQIGDQPVQEPAPLPTAFGATSVGSAVAASAMAGPDRGDRSDAGDSPATRDLPEDRPQGAVDDTDVGDARSDMDAAHDRDAEHGPTAVGVAAVPMDTTPEEDRDRDGVPDAAEAEDRDRDRDRDGVPDAAEDRDRDDDGMPDAAEDVDRDRDGVPDRQEPEPAVLAAVPAASVVAPAVPIGAASSDDRDRDGVPDAAEDRDHDGVPDTALDRDHDGVPDTALDRDHDGVPDVAEGGAGGSMTAENGELMPGAVEAVPVTALWDSAQAQALRDRWQDIQLRFVDDPQDATRSAGELVSEAVDTLAARLHEQRERLGGWQSNDSADTEHLRVALRQYRDFMDRLLDL